MSVSVSSDLSSSVHITDIVAKAHKRECAILRIFTSLDIHLGLLMRAFLVYVRPIVEYNLIIWSPSMIHDIDSLESLQRRFTEQLPGVMNLFYYERLKHLNVSIPENCVVSTQICFGVTKLCLVSYI